MIETPDMGFFVPTQGYDYFESFVKKYL